jgi:cytochrome c-type biogenesis protein CcmE
MSQTPTTWEKTSESVSVAGRAQRQRFLIGGIAILVAIVFMIVNGTLNNAQYFITVEELTGRPELVGQDVRTSGVVLGETIDYDSDTLTIRFTMANVPEETDNLAQTLHLAAMDLDSPRIPVVVENEPMPDLLQHEAQAIVTGELGEDGVFYATELLLKCPTRYEEALPDQSDAEANAAPAM